MHDKERMIRELFERRKLAQSEPQPLRILLTWFLSQQEREIQMLQEARATA